MTGIRHLAPHLCAALVCAAESAAQQAPASLALDSLLSVPISAASKYAQKAAEAPASVTIITADEIRQHRYRTLSEVLEGVRGFAVSNDRNYSYLGARGFSRPTDYNNRILFLVDGHSINDQIWAGAPFGSEIPINLDAVERIEIVRGPGSALYGSNAMLGVINVVTKTGTQLEGTTASASAGSGSERRLALATGRALGNNGSVALSALGTRSEGGDLYFAEFDTPQQNFGIARGLDWERAGSVLAALTWKNLTVNTGYRSRSKGIPTGAYSSAFGDARARTLDATAWLSVSARRDLRNVVHLSGRIYGDRYTYRGTYPENAGPAYRDEGGSTDAGIEGMMVWDVSSRDRLTVGSELRHVLRADYIERHADGTVTQDDQPFDVASVFVQNELQVKSWLAFVAGVRHDDKRKLHAATTPRFALIATVNENTTLKLLYGEAFRSPSPAEATITTSFYTSNPGLGPERIRTWELELQRRASSAVLLAVSAYRYHMSDLIEQVARDTIGTITFGNIASVRAQGAEMQLDFVPGALFSARVTYALQAANDHWSGERLTNSPEQVGSASAQGRARNGVGAAAVVRYESGRRALTGGSTPAFTRSDLTVRYAPPPGSRLHRKDGGELSLRTTNVFDARYALPGGLEHIQRVLPQYRRMFSLRCDLSF